MRSTADRVAPQVQRAPYMFDPIRDEELLGVIGGRAQPRPSQSTKRPRPAKRDPDECVVKYDVFGAYCGDF